MNPTNGSAATLPIRPPPPAEDVAHAATALRLERGHRVSGGALDACLASDRWRVLTEGIRETAPAERPGYARRFAGAAGRRKHGPAILAALEAAEAIVDEAPDDPGPEEPAAEGPASFKLDVLGARDFARTEFRLSWAVRRIFVHGQPGVVGAPKKGMKTTTMIDLAVSAATGSPFLGTFEVPEPMPVLFLSGESGGFVLKDTVRRVCKAKGIDDWAAALEGRFFIGFTLPQLSSPEQVAALSAVIRENGIKVVMIDPLYLCLIGAAADGRRVDPANLFDMGPLFLEVSRACLDAGATPILIHHFKLTGQTPGEMPELENMAYAGIQEFARQWILLGRRERFEAGSGLHKLWMTVGGSAGHSGEWGIDIDEGVMDDDFTGRTWDVVVKPAAEIIAEKVEKAQGAAVARLTGKAQAHDEVKARQLLADAARALG